MRKSRIAIAVCLGLMLTMVVSVPAFAEVLEITINDHNPEMAPPAKAMDFWAQKVEEASGGKVKMTVHHGGSILKGDEAYRGTQTGIVDAAHYVLDRQQGFIINTVMSLPFMGWPGQVETGEIYAKLREEFPEVRGEFKGVIPYVFCMMPPTHIHTTKKAIKTPADLKGMKFHGAEVALVRTMAAAGATPIELDISDMYMGLDRGLVDGVMNHFAVLKVFGVLELLKYHTVFGEGGVNMVPMGIIFNEEKWNSYPPDIQKLLTDSAHFYSETFYAGDAAFLGMVQQEAKDANHTFTYLTPDDIKDWYNLVKESVHDSWIEEAESKGLPGKAVHKYILKEVKKYQK
jgi:TRAP-type C4-dicarboxylate transport system substrate-binding protein